MGLRDFIFGEKNRVTNVDELERLGTKFWQDWHLTTRIDAETDLNQQIASTDDLDQKVACANQKVDQVASFYGAPGDDTNFFIAYRNWKQLYGYYKIGRESGGLEEDAQIGKAHKLLMLADVCIAKSKLKIHVTPETPIVIHAPQQGGGSGGVNPFWRTDLRKNQPQQTQGQR